VEHTITQSTEMRASICAVGGQARVAPGLLHFLSNFSVSCVESCGTQGLKSEGA
jgi:hypothetical protein